MKGIYRQVGWTTQSLKEPVQKDAKRLCLNAVRQCAEDNVQGRQYSLSYEVT